MNDRQLKQIMTKLDEIEDKLLRHIGFSGIARLKKCPTCGKEILTNAIYCLYCETKY